MIEKDTYEKMIIARDGIIVKLLATLSIVVVVFGLTVTAMTLAYFSYMSQYEYTSTVDVKADGDASAIYQNGRGNLIDGGTGEGSKKTD